MKQTKTGQTESDSKKATTLEGREDQIIALAVDLAEQQIRNGTASSQIITHYLKLGSSRERLEKDILKEQKKLISAKTEAIESEKRIEELYKQALVAMSSYRGDGPSEEEDPYDR